MEPFRVLIDQKIFQMKLIDFEHNEKMQLVDVLNQEVLIDGKKQYVNNAIKIYCKSVFDIRVLVFVNLRSYLTDEQIQELMEEALRQQIYVVLVENSQKNCIEGGKRYIIDKDMCEIL